MGSLYISEIPLAKWRFSPVGRATVSATVVGSIPLVLLVMSLTAPEKSRKSAQQIFCNHNVVRSRIPKWLYLVPV